MIYRNKEDSEKKSYASIAAVPRIVPAIVIPAPIVTQNSFSALQDSTSGSEPEVDMRQFDWNEVSNASQSETSDTRVNDQWTYSDESANEENTSEVEDTATSEDTSSEEELIVNQKSYRRVRQPWCKGGVPCFVSSLAILLGFAYFMQFIFYMCGLVNDDCCGPAARLECSKSLIGL